MSLQDLAGVIKLQRQGQTVLEYSDLSISQTPHPAPACDMLAVVSKEERHGMLPCRSFKCANLIPVGQNTAYSKEQRLLVLRTALVHHILL